MLCPFLVRPGGPNALLPPASAWQQATTAGQDYIKVLPLLFPDSELDQGAPHLVARHSRGGGGGFASNCSGSGSVLNMLASE